MSSLAAFFISNLLINNKNKNWPIICLSVIETDEKRYRFGDIIMSPWHKNIYDLWKKHHPTFDREDYARWIKERGYYKSALDISKPEFYEYATLYLSKRYSQ